MSDKELLELAAKAAGIVVARSRLDDPLHNDILISPSVRNPYQHSGTWNPLTDDGDALRLAVKLKISPMYGFPCVAVCAFARGDSDDADPYAATRRAITRAAAAIGKSL
jgi:hypothetical protein